MLAAVYRCASRMLFLPFLPGYFKSKGPAKIMKFCYDRFEGRKKLFMFELERG
jgi:hypothetical protein